jgi:hypothetical protein
MDEHEHDPRHKDVGDQLPEEQHEGAAEGGGRGDDRDEPQRRESGAEEGDPQQATGNPRAAG